MPAPSAAVIEEQRPVEAERHEGPPAPRFASDPTRSTTAGRRGRGGDGSGRQMLDPRHGAELGAAAAAADRHVLGSAPYGLWRAAGQRRRTRPPQQVIAGWPSRARHKR